jgi:hypothetical protein
MASGRFSRSRGNRAIIRDRRKAISMRPAGDQVTDHASLISLTPPLDRDGLRRLARLACLELYRVEWRRCYLASDGTRMLCWYRSPDAEAVRLILRQQGTAGAAVWPVDVTGPRDAELPDGGRSCVAVELDFDTPLGAAELASMRDSIEVALEAATLAISRTFTSRHGTRLVCSRRRCERDCRITMLACRTTCAHFGLAMHRARSRADRALSIARALECAKRSRIDAEQARCTSRP